jgi:hypothetical protein
METHLDLVLFHRPAIARDRELTVSVVTVWSILEPYGHTRKVAMEWASICNKVPACGLILQLHGIKQLFTKDTGKSSQIRVKYLFFSPNSANYPFPAKKVLPPHFPP